MARFFKTTLWDLSTSFCGKLASIFSLHNMRNFPLCYQRDLARVAEKSSVWNLAMDTEVFDTRQPFDLSFIVFFDSPALFDSRPTLPGDAVMASIQNDRKTNKALRSSHGIIIFFLRESDL